ncbi:TonB-dependent receptor [Vulcaniibacterium tengchongense]|uniref:Outer membrane receptor protein involved in Fe transport n=1 Tax=Vulcaniibacterium tengchongense TaxID=1273429 RepID=A0A3N4V4A4_9GAMM|nr:TonB-dependent receptor [Vulcaniibacterium tengchongense]RPE76903.1 outer membrane receptor protein involved in Fe transport [Vulcaniibacterium tengchongense]
MCRLNTNRYALSVAIAIALSPWCAQAQTPPTEPPAAAAQGATAPAADERGARTTLDTVVVTGTATSGGVKKLEASFNIVTANEEEIRQANPKSTADLLKISPGMWPESTGGQTGANIEIAGFPGGGDAPYFSTLLMGSPLYGMPTLSFFETTSMFRLDDTVASVEILQGGPSVVFADGQMGATANFFLKTGSETPSGSVGMTYGDEGLWRLDAFSGFKIAEGWYGSVGGFWRESDGVRDPQFKADKGGQITATLSHEFDGGNFVLYARYLNDKNQFITPIPLIQEGRDEFHPYPGFDPLTGTYNSKHLQHVFLPTYPGGGKQVDLADGRGADMFFFGGNFDLDLGNGWTISDKFLYDEGDMDTNALFSSFNPVTLAEMLYGVDTPGGFELPAGSATATYVGGGTVPLDRSVIAQGWWHIHKYLKSFNNDLRLSKELFEGNTLTMGFYINSYRMNDKWSLGNTMLMTNEPNARPITVSYVGEDGVVRYRTDPQGFSDFGGFHIHQYGRATNMAIYLSDTWRIGKWLLDLSGRLENQDATNNVCNLRNVDLDGDPNTLYDNATPVCDGTYTRNHYKKSHPSWTAGANYAFTDRMSAYGRVNTGGHFPDFDNGIRSAGGAVPLQRIRNYEIGFKYQSDWLYADISAYRRKFTGLQYQPTDGEGTPVGSPRFYGSDSKGVNFIGALTPTDALRIQLVANYLDGEYTDYDACLPYVDINGGENCAPIEGQQLQRQPKLRYMITPSYRFDLPWGDITPYVTYTHVGDHTQDQSGLQQLGSYHTVDFGVTANIGYNWQINLRGTNMTDELGLTESNSRIFGAATTSNNVLLARPLEGREVNLQVKYLW